MTKAGVRTSKTHKKVKSSREKIMMNKKKSSIKLSLKSHYKARQRELANIPLRAIPLTQ